MMQGSQNKSNQSSKNTEKLTGESKETMIPLGRLILLSVFEQKRHPLIFKLQNMIIWLPIMIPNYRYSSDEELGFHLKIFLSLQCHHMR